MARSGKTGARSIGWWLMVSAGRVNCIAARAASACRRARLSQHAAARKAALARGPAVLPNGAFGPASFGWSPIDCLPSRKPLPSKLNAVPVPPSSCRSNVARTADRDPFVGAAAGTADGLSLAPVFAREPQPAMDPAAIAATWAAGIAIISAVAADLRSAHLTGRDEES